MTTYTERSKKAEMLFKEGYNCAQSVFLAFEDVHGMNRNTGAKLTSAMGGGMGRLREVCGCVSSMFLVLGLIEGCGPDDSDYAHEKKKKLYETVQTLAAEFKQEHGSIICRELLGRGDQAAAAGAEESAEPSLRTEDYYSRRPCADLCGFAVKTLEEYLNI